MTNKYNLGIITVPLNHPACKFIDSKGGRNLKDEKALLEALDCPEGTKLIGVSPHVLFQNNQMTFKIRNKNLVETLEGNQIPIVKPQWATTMKEGEKIWVRWEYLR